MKIFRYILLFLMIFSLCYCDKDIEPIEETHNKVISVSVSYVNKASDKDTIPDVGARLYVFNDISITDVTSYKYIPGEGVLIRKNDPKIYFDQVYLIPHTGEISISLDKDMDKVLIAVESNHLKKEKRIVWLSENQLKYLSQTRIHKVVFLP
ncbi:MAG: hypothetical protein GX752_08415 [Clostridium sp.]|nr:hypothetical protein [Clostridium sp.]